MNAAFIINNRNKGKYVYRCVQGALAQTYPCEIFISDYDSTDSSFSEIERAIRECPAGAEHEVTVTRCPLGNAEGRMESANAHFDWCVSQTKADWVFQCSSDDYSLPDRVKICMDAANRNRCSAIATTMYFTTPGVEILPDHPVQFSGYPKNTGYITGSDGLISLAFGSCIAGYHRKFMDKIGSPGPCTMDVYYGYLASLHHGYFAIAHPQHVHVMHEDFENIGFQGKMRAAEKEGNMETMTRLNELNRFQLAQVYLRCALAQQKLFPLAQNQDQLSVRQMFTDQCVGWMNEREKLHANRWMPGII